MASKRKSAAHAGGLDAIEMIVADHKKVKILFEEFKSLGAKAGARKSSLVRQICDELKVHTALEEELLYPAIREAIREPDLMDAALVEHAAAKDLIGQLQEMNADEDLYDAKVTVLGTQIEQHVEEEEGEMLPKARKANLDSGSLGERMQARRTQLMQEMGMSDEQPAEKTVKKKSAGNG